MSRQDPLPRHYTSSSHCLCALAHLGPWPPTWTVAFGFQQNRIMVKKPFGCLIPSTDWIHPGFITHQRLFFHVCHWLHGKSCKYCLLSCLKLRSECCLSVFETKLLWEKNKTCFASSYKDFSPVCVKGSLYCRNLKWKRSMAHRPTDVGCSYPLVGSQQQQGCLLTSPRMEISASILYSKHF